MENLILQNIADERMLQLALLLGKPSTEDGSNLNITIDSLQELGNRLVPGYKLSIQDSEELKAQEESSAMRDKINRWKQLYGSTEEQKEV